MTEAPPALYSQQACHLVDPVLPTLAPLLSANPRATILQYWPRKRCTIRVVADGKPYFVKVYPRKFLRKQRGSHIHDVCVALWEASIAGEISFRVPKPIGWDNGSLTLSMELLPGVPAIEMLTQPDSLTQANRIGLAAASISRVKFLQSRTFDYSEQLKDSKDIAAELIRRAPRFRHSVEELLQHLEQLAPIASTRPLVVVHGDMHIDQWLVENGELGLLDFDDVAWGHSERDAAFFMVQLEDYPSPLEFANPLNRAFLQGYEAVAGALDERLMRMYMAHKWLAKSLRATRRQAPESTVCARVCLQRALRCVEGISEN